MALSSETRRSPRYIGTGSETIFPFAFKLLKPTDLEVRVALSGQVETTLEESAYTVVLNESQDNNPGGTVTLKAPLAKDAALVIISDTPYLQPTTYTNRGGFYPEQLNTNLDRLTILTQQLKEHLDRTITVPPTSPTSPQELFYQLLNAAKEALESAQSAEEALAACEQIRQLIEQYSWDIPHIVDSLREVEQYPYDGLFAVGGYGDPGRKGQNISNRYVKAEGSTELRTLGERFADIVNVKDYGAVGDGVHDDTAAIQGALAAGTFAFVPEGQYKISLSSTEVLLSLELNRLVGFGDLVLTDTILRSAESPAVISADSDTGPSGNAYSGGAAGTPTTPGRTTGSQVALIASQNCRSQGVRAVNIGSIYSWAYGNVSGNYSSRQSVASCPQSANVGCEECEVYGFQGTNIASHFSDIEAGGGANVACRLSYSNGYNSSNISTVSCVAGKGFGARLTVTVENGAVTSVAVVNGGQDYDETATVEFYDRSTAGTGASASISIGENGTITAVSVVSGGSGYSQNTDAVVKSNSTYSINIASNTSKNSGNYTSNVASSQCEIDDASSTAANIASVSSKASGIRAVTLGSTGSTSTGSGAMVLSGNLCQATADGAVVFGRRTINNVNRSIAFGDATSGSVSTANRKLHVFPSGDVQAAGTITGSQAFTDYAEFFENLTLGEIPLGTLVTLDGDKVRRAETGDDILGVVSGTAFVIGGDTPFTWAKRFKTGEFGEMLYQDILDPDWQPTIPDPNWEPNGAEPETLRPMIPNPSPQPTIRVPVENGEYDASQVNIPRSQRSKEWTCVGLLGQLHVRVDASVSAGSWVKPKENGIGTNSLEKTNLRCMSIKQAFDETIGYAVALCFMR